MKQTGRDRRQANTGTASRTIVRIALALLNRDIRRLTVSVWTQNAHRGRPRTFRESRLATATGSLMMWADSLGYLLVQTIQQEHEKLMRVLRSEHQPQQRR